MKKKKMFKVAVIVVIIVVGFIVRACHSYYYSKISDIELPEGTRTIKVHVGISDIYGLHVCAEKIIETPLSCEEVAQYINENNRDENIHIFSIFEYKDIYDIEWDDYLIDLDCIKEIEKEGMNYYLITNNTQYGSLRY